MHIERTHDLGKDEAKRRVQEVADKLAGEYNLRCEWQQDKLNFAGSGVNGCIAVADDRIDIDAKLGFGLSLLEGSIRSTIESTIDKYLK